MKLLIVWKLWLALAAFTTALNHAIQVYDTARDARRVYASTPGRCRRQV